MHIMKETVSPVQRERLHDQVVRHIALRVLRSATSDGHVPLPNEVELTRQLNVSRTVVREAIKVLASKGLVEVRPKTGMRVRPRGEWNLLDPDLLAWQNEVGPDEQFFRELGEVRLIIEIAAAERAAAQADAVDIEALDHWYQQMEQNVDDADAFIAADMQFHAAIVTACHNALLKQMSGAIGTALRTSRLVSIQAPGAAAASLPVHRAVADAIRNHDRIAARAAMERLLVQAAQDVDRVLHDPTTTASSGL